MTLHLGPIIGQIGGAQVEQIPVSMSGGGATTYPLTTVDAGDGALIAVAGTLSTTQENTAGGPQFYVGNYMHGTPWTVLTSPHSSHIGGLFTGVTAIRIVTRHSFSNTTTFTGTVYVARL